MEEYFLKINISHPAFDSAPLERGAHSAGQGSWKAARPSSMNSSRRFASFSWLRCAARAVGAVST